MLRRQESSQRAGVTPDAPANAGRAPAQTPETFRDVRDMGNGREESESRCNRGRYGSRRCYAAGSYTVPDQTGSDPR